MIQQYIDKSNQVSNSMFDWLQVKLLDPRILAMVIIAVGSTLILHGYLKIKDAKT